MRTTTIRSGLLARLSLAALSITALLPSTALLIAVGITAAGFSPRAHAAAPSLADAWLETLPTLTAPVSWSHAYGLLSTDLPRQRQEHRYLVEELNTLMVSSRMAGNAKYTQAITAWRDTLLGTADAALRSPKRLDLPYLGANLREAPLLDRMAYWGACEIPNWVEVWALHGVTRMPWQPNMTLDTLKNQAPPDAFSSIDYIHLVTPQADVLHRGIAAWNHENTPLAPGSRVLVELPNRQGLAGALPFPGTTHELDIINQRLPGVLAAQLPGDQCTQWHAH